MKSNFRGMGLAGLCSWFGITRQAYYQSKHSSLKASLEEEIIMQKILDIRALHPRLGGRKLFSKLSYFLTEHRISMGRDAFFDLLRKNRLLVKSRKRYHITTNSNHWMRKYPNLIKELIPTSPEQIWMSDITYWKTRHNPLYISFITDAYSRKIVGYQVAKTMEAAESVSALNMAVKSLKPGASGLIHHSDRGSQYCSSHYVKVLQNKGIGISMTENSDPLENAIAERLNGIIKGEYLFDYDIKDLKTAKTVLRSVVKLYNEDRPHSSISNLTPVELHERITDMEIRRLWKNYYKKKEMSYPDINPAESAKNASVI